MHSIGSQVAKCKKNIFNCLGVSVATCMAILQVGSGLQLRSASTGTKEEDYENDAATIVQKCVSIMSTTFSMYAQVLVLRHSLVLHVCMLLLRSFYIGLQ